MATKNVNSKGTKQLFENPILEKLTHTHIAIPLTIFYGSAVGIMCYITISLNYQLTNALVLFLGGIFFWTIFEYLMHRHIFHMIPNHPIKEKIQYTFHGVHHEYPKDKTRLAMPPLMSAFLTGILFLFFLLIFGLGGLAFGAGFISGYATYLIFHYCIHAYKPPNNFLKILWKHHLIHHYKDDEVAFGVSTIVWDRLFQTMPKKKKEHRQ